MIIRDDEVDLFLWGREISDDLRERLAWVFEHEPEHPAAQRILRSERYARNWRNVDWSQFYEEGTSEAESSISDPETGQVDSSAEGIRDSSPKALMPVDAILAQMDEDISRHPSRRVPLIPTYLFLGSLGLGVILYRVGLSWLFFIGIPLVVYIVPYFVFSSFTFFADRRASSLHLTGDDRRAFYWARIALWMSRWAFEARDASHFARLNLLADVVENHGRYLDAERLRKEAIRCARESGREEDLAVSLTNLGMLHFQIGQYDLAEAFLRRALEMLKLNSASKVIQARFMGALGAVLGVGTKQEEGLSLLSTALAWEEGENVAPMEKCRTKWLIGGVLQSLERYAESQEYLEQALEVAQRLEPANLGTGQLIETLARNVAAQGQIEESGRMLEQALEIWRRHGLQNARAWRIAHSYGVFCLRVGRKHEAISWLTHSLALLQGAYDESHDFVQTCLRNLAIAYQSIGQGSEADKTSARVRLSEAEFLVVSRRFGLMLAV